MLRFNNNVYNNTIVIVIRHFFANHEVTRTAIDAAAWPAPVDARYQMENQGVSATTISDNNAFMISSNQFILQAILVIATLV